MKGLSPVIATILMVAVAVAAAVMAYTWAGSFQSSSQSGIEGKGSGLGSYVIKIENIDKDNNKIYVRNVGEKDISSGTWSVYVNGVKCTISSPASGTFALTKGSVQEVLITGCTLSANKIVSVASPAGVSDLKTITT